MRAPSRRRCRHVLAYTPSGGTPEYLATLRDYYRRLGFELGGGRDPRHDGRQRGAALRVHGLRGRRRRGRCVVEPFYTNYHGLRDDGRRAPRAAHEPRRGRLSPAAARGLGARAHARARAWCSSAIPNNPTGTVYTARGAADGRGVLPRSRSLPGRGRGLSRVRLRRPRSTSSALSLAGFEEQRRRGRQPLQALQRLRHPPGLPGHAQPASSTAACLRMAQGRLSPPGLAQLVAPAALPSCGSEYYADGIVREYQARRDVLFEALTRDPRRLPAQARGRVLLHRPPAGPRRRGLRALPARRLQPGRARP